MIRDNDFWNLKIIWTKNNLKSNRDRAFYPVTDQIRKNPKQIYLNAKLQLEITKKI